ncbi:MAG TPA: glycoside hydrolase family 15 protein [Candidatus Saccharimonadales bacterium]|nr:glycoside hydrolase family 15 protein [Candidatus Saccharimonadales bacterium]
MAYQPIESYGIIGDLHTVALVGADGAIDWMCYPRFDSPSVFAAILDDAKGGRFRIAPSAAKHKCKQFYWPDTNILVTRFLSPDGVGEIRDYMPVEEDGGRNVRHRLIRRVSVVRGTLDFHLECRPAFNYARDDHELTILPRGARFSSPSLCLGLTSAIKLEADGGAAVADFTMNEGETRTFVLQALPSPDAAVPALSEKEEGREFLGSVAYWRRWLGRCTYRGRWREMVHRSALALKLMNYAPTGAIVAAPTCSLPEGIGGTRNWDYRFTWIRDAAFTLYGLMRIGFTEEASRFMHWLEDRLRNLNEDGSLNVMYSIDGSEVPDEVILDHLEGYRGSSPVRIGNGAAHQLQLDIYGELMDSVYLFNKYGTPISYDLWQSLRRLIDWVCDNWKREDEGIWEVRGGRQHFVYSKLMCWVALDRGLRLAQKRSFPADQGRWLSVRDQIYEEIMARGWSESRKAFVQNYGSDSLDAANLIMPLVFFLSPTDPRMLSTLDAVMRPPSGGGLVSNSLVHRYNLGETDDGLPGGEGTFNICTFWLVEALTRAGRVDDARLLFEEMLGYANHLGLYAEETGPSAEALGNFPQAFTHLALISAAFNLDRVLGAKG